MKKFFIVAGVIAALGIAAFLVFTYWDRILAFITAGARVGSNVLKNFTGDKADLDDPIDYYDI